MDTTERTATPDIALLCRLRAAVQWLETPRPFASTAVDLAELMTVAAPLVADVAPPVVVEDNLDPLRTLAALHGYYTADTEVARRDDTLLTATLDASRRVLAVAFCATAVA